MSVMLSRKWAGILHSQIKKKVNLIELEEAVGENSEVFNLSERATSVSDSLHGSDNAGSLCNGLKAGSKK